MSHVILPAFNRRLPSGFCDLAIFGVGTQPLVVWGLSSLRSPAFGAWAPTSDGGVIKQENICFSIRRWWHFFSCKDTDAFQKRMMNLLFYDTWVTLTPYVSIKDIYLSLSIYLFWLGLLTIVSNYHPNIRSQRRKYFIFEWLTMIYDWDHSLYISIFYQYIQEKTYSS